MYKIPAVKPATVKEISGISKDLGLKCTDEELKDYTGIALFQVNRGSYMTAHVLLNLLNKLGKSDKMQGLSSILSLFCNKFNQLNNTRARILIQFII